MNTGSTMSYNVVAPITQQRTHYPIPVSALAFDPVSDCLWASNTTGTLSAYHGHTRLRGVYFPAGDNHPVKKITAGDIQVRALPDSGTGLGAWSKGGVNKWYFR
jgi:PAB-dependent poly(A)-specific ribonuclease subunit 2